MILSAFSVFPRLNNAAPRKHIPVLIPSLFPSGITPDINILIYIPKLHSRGLHGPLSSIFQA